MTKSLDNGGSLAVDRSEQERSSFFSQEICNIPAGAEVTAEIVPTGAGAARRRAVSARLGPSAGAAGRPGPARPTR